MNFSGFMRTRAQQSTKGYSSDETSFQIFPKVRALQAVKLSKQAQSASS
jgi:hypothetical protein